MPFSECVLREKKKRLTEVFKLLPANIAYIVCLYTSCSKKYSGGGAGRRLSGYRGWGPSSAGSTCHVLRTDIKEGHFGSQSVCLVETEEPLETYWLPSLVYTVQLQTAETRLQRREKIEGEA